MNNNMLPLVEFCKRNRILIHNLYDPSCFNDDGTIMSMADQAAVITHYLFLKETPNEITYKTKSLLFLEAWKKGILNGSLKVR